MGVADSIRRLLQQTASACYLLIDDRHYTVFLRFSSRDWKSVIFLIRQPIVAHRLSQNTSSATLKNSLRAGGIVCDSNRPIYAVFLFLDWSEM